MKERVKYQVLNDEKCEKIFNGALDVLSQTGCEINSEEARDMLKAAGCTVEGTRVKIPANLVKNAIKSAPSSFKLYNRDGEEAVDLSPWRSQFGPCLTNTNTIDLETREKRLTVKEDAANTARVIEALPNIDFGSGLVTISDCSPEIMDIHEAHAVLPNTKKPFISWSYNKENLIDIIEMCEAVAGSLERLAEKPFVIFLWCAMSPLGHVKEAMEEIMYCAEKNLPVTYVVGVMQGGQGPTTVAGNLVIGLADTLTGLVVSQVKKPGAPFMVTSWTDMIDMSSVSISHTGPDFSIGAAASADIFRYLDLPFGLHLGSTDSPVFDQQAAGDIATQLYTGALCGGNMTEFCGYLETATTSCLETLAFADEIVSMLRPMVDGIEVNDETMAIDAIKAVGPGGNFLGEEHTFNHFKELWRKTDFVRGLTRENWIEQGRETLYDRLNKKVKKIVAAGSSCPLDPEVQAKIDAIVERAEKRVQK